MGEWITEANRAPEKRTFADDRQAGRAPWCEATGCWENSCCPAKAARRFCSHDNSTNNDRLFPGRPNASPYVKDGINDCVVQGKSDAVNPEKKGTKASAIIGRQSRPWVRHGPSASARKISASQPSAAFGDAFEAIFAARIREADEFYASVTPPAVGEDAAAVMRQPSPDAVGQAVLFLRRGQWLEEHNSTPAHRVQERPQLGMVHISTRMSSPSGQVEYPWSRPGPGLSYPPLSIATRIRQGKAPAHAARGLSATKRQMPPTNGTHSDVNPPVHAWATLFLHRTEQALRGKGDMEFLKTAFNNSCSTSPGG